MKIIDDQIVFSEQDFAELSDFAKKSLSLYVGERAFFPGELGATLNREVEAAKSHFRHLTLLTDQVRELVNGLAAADEETLASVAPLLKQLKIALSGK